MKEGWSYKKLGEVCEILNGFAFKSNIYAPKGIRVIRITNVQKGFIEDTEPKFYPFDSIDELNRYLLKSQDLLISLTGNVGRVALLAENMLPAYLNQRVGCIRVKNEKELSISYLYHLLNSNEFEKNCIQSAHGAAQKNMSTVWLANYKIPIPPLQEQHSIVSRLDSAFSHIDALKANAEKQLNEARKFFQAELAECMKPKEGWEEKKLGNICKVINGRAYSKNEMLKSGKYRLLRVGNFFTNESWYYSNLELEEDKYCNNGDLLYAWSASFGPRIWNGEKVIYHYHIWKMVCSHIIDKYFLYYWLDSDELKKQTMTNLHGTTMAHITKGIIEAANVNYPSIEKQHAIVSHLDSLSSTIRKLEELQQKTIAECDALKQAMLKEVFE